MSVEKNPSSSQCHLLGLCEIFFHLTSHSNQSPFFPPVSHSRNPPSPLPQFSLNNVTVKNTGKGFSVSGGLIPSYQVSGGGLSGEYQLAQFHFHWGVPEELGGPRRGSEHTVNGRQSPAEVHFVHYKTKFANLGEAVESGEKDALAVIGVLIESDKSAVEMLGDDMEVRK